MNFKVKNPHSIAFNFPRDDGSDLKVEVGEQTLELLSITEVQRLRDGGMTVEVPAKPKPSVAATADESEPGDKDGDDAGAGEPSGAST